MANSSTLSRPRYSTRFSGSDYPEIASSPADRNHRICMVFKIIVNYIFLRFIKFLYIARLSTSLMRDSMLASVHSQNPSINQVIEPTRPIVTQQPPPQSPPALLNESTRLVRNNYSVPAFRAFQNYSNDTLHRQNNNDSTNSYHNSYFDDPSTPAIQSQMYCKTN